VVTRPSLFYSVLKTKDLLPRGAKSKLLVFIFLQLIVSIFDAVGIVFTGLIASLAFVMATNSSRPTVFESVIEILDVPNISDSMLLLLLGFLILFLFIFRTVASLAITRQTFKFLAKISQDTSRKFFTALLGAPYEWIRKQNTLDLSFAMCQGMQLAMIGINGQVIILISEFLFVLLILILLILINPLMTFVSAFLFLLFGSIVYWFSSTKVSNLSKLMNQKLIEGNQQTINAVRLFREFRLKSTTPYIIEKFKQNREVSSVSFASISWLQLVPRFAIEITVVLGVFCLTIAATFSSNLQDAVSYLAIFIASTSRIGPSALRIQTSTLTIHAMAGELHLALQIYDDLIPFAFETSRDNSAKPLEEVRAQFRHPIPKISFEDVSFGFEDSKYPVLSNVSFEVTPGETIALVGPSGSGKSTLLDLLLGLLKPTSGKVSIHGRPPQDLIVENPGLIAYLPQDPFIMPGSIKNNITLGSKFVDENSFVSALRAAGLIEIVATLEKGEETWIGEGGNKLSGGQRQRIALARALYLEPKVILLDEPTSALDAEAESHVMMAMQQLKGKASLLMIVHRLSTLNQVDKVIYIKAGRVLAIGTLSEVRRQVKDFDQQAKLLGI